MRWTLVGIFSGWLLAASGAGAFSGKVIGVHDGDTITVLRADKSQVSVRLNQIDAPELGQAFGQAAKKALAALVFGQMTEITDHGLDKYGRTIGTDLRR
jgi:endonuclease YncB( thermonuclease family)